MSELQSLNPQTLKAPATRIKDVTSLNSIVSNLANYDSENSLFRVDVQKSIDGKPPYDPAYLESTGQKGRCNLNFGDMKARLKLEEASYYDLTESVPTLAVVQTDLGDPVSRQEYTGTMSEEWHRTLKEWDAFDVTHQLLVKKFCSHGIGVLYFMDDLDWRWYAAGLDDFKFPRMTTLSTDEMDVVAVFRDVTVGKLYSWIESVSAGDKRWNLMEVKKAILRASDGITTFADNLWEKWQSMAKNNDIFASATAQDTVHVAHVWVREFTGRVSQFMTLKDGSNNDYLFKCYSRFDGPNQCFTIFPYEVGTNGLLHSVRGLAHEIYPIVQVLNDVRCQTVDSSKLSGSLLIQPATASSAEDLAIMFFGGAAYIPPGVQIQNNSLNNPATNILPVIQDMNMLLRRNSGDVNSQSPDASQREKTKFQYQAELMKENQLPVAAMDLFYQPWKRHLNEVARRFQRKNVKKTDPGGAEILEFRKRCLARGVPKELLFSFRVEPMRAIGYGSPTNRLMAYEKFMQYYGSLDPIGQNNLLRDLFAQDVKYSMVDRYVTPLQQSRAPVDVEIADLQNTKMDTGAPAAVLPNDHHIIHVQSHLPSVDADLTALEQGQGTPQQFAAAQTKAQHIAQHLQMVKPDKLQADTVNELNRQFNNVAERVQAAGKRIQDEAPTQPGQPSPEDIAHQQKIQNKEEEHQQKMQHRQQDAIQKQGIRDAEAAARIAAQNAATTLKNNLTARRGGR